MSTLAPFPEKGMWFNIELTGGSVTSVDAEAGEVTIKWGWTGDGDTDRTKAMSIEEWRRSAEIVDPASTRI